MAYEPAHYRLDDPSPLPMVTLTGELVVLVVAAVDVEPERVELHGTLSWEHWDLVDDVGAFHLDLDEHDPLAADDGDVEVVLALRRPLLDLCESNEDLLATLFAEEPGTLNETEAWLLASAMQHSDVPDLDDATTSFGFRTRWARPFG